MGHGPMNSNSEPRGLVAQEHVVATGEQCPNGTEAREGEGDWVDPPGGIGAGRRAHAKHEQARGGERARVGDEVGEEQQVRERLPDVGREHGLHRRAERREVDKLHQQRRLGALGGGDRHERDGVGERQRQVHLRRPLASQRVRELLADEGRQDDDRERASGRDGPGVSHRPAAATRSAATAAVAISAMACSPDQCSTVPAMVARPPAAPWWIGALPREQRPTG
jgi:hypothetical protein